MRYAVNHKEESRGRIIAAAAQQFRGRGVEAVRVADVMQQAGLTHGGFYKHFGGKEELFEEATALALSQISSRLLQMTRGMRQHEALRTVIEFYLSEEHLQHPELGCVFAALGPEISRMPRTLKRRVSAQLDAYAARLESLMPGKSAAEKRSSFHVLFSSMAGCLMAARAYTDEATQREILHASSKFFIESFCLKFVTANHQKHL